MDDSVLQSDSCRLFYEVLSNIGISPQTIIIMYIILSTRGVSLAVLCDPVTQLVMTAEILV